MMRLIKIIPNTLTQLNLLSGCLAVFFALNNQLDITVLFVLLGIFFDFFDGFLARLLNVKSELGKQLDSLADLITSGFVPGVVMVQLLLKASHKEPILYMLDKQEYPLFPLFGLSITLASAYRLANFNIDTRQSYGFIGLPTPANTLLILSLPMIYMYEEYQFINYIIDNPYVLFLITILSCYMLNANIELFALKFKTYAFKENKLKYLFLLFSIAAIIIFRIVAIPIIILCYLLVSLFYKRK